MSGEEIPHTSTRMGAKQKSADNGSKQEKTHFLSFSDPYYLRQLRLVFLTLRPFRRDNLSVGGQRTGTHLQHTQKSLTISVVERTDCFHAGVRFRVHLVRHSFGRFKLRPALVEFQFDCAGGDGVDGCDCGAGHVGGEIEAIALIDLLGDKERKLIEEFAASAVENQLQEVGIRSADQLHARSFIDAAALDADEAVFDEVCADPDAVLTAECIGSLNRFESGRLLAIERRRSAVLESYAHAFWRIWSIFGQHSHAWRDEPRVGGEVFQFAGF